MNTTAAATAHADLEALHRHLDEHPDDQRARRDLADHLDERGDPDGEAVRYLAERGKSPHFLLGGGFAGWVWFGPGASLCMAHQARLTGALWLGLCCVRQRSQSYLFISNLDSRAAEADFCRAYHAAKAAGWDPHGAA